jgi:hypothetical protein
MVGIMLTIGKLMTSEVNLHLFRRLEEEETQHGMPRDRWRSGICALGRTSVQIRSLWSTREVKAGDMFRRKDISMVAKRFGTHLSSSTR